MKYLSTYKIFEAGASHWREDLIVKLKWNRLEEIYDFLLEFADLGWHLPKKEILFRSGSSGVVVDIYDSNFNTPGKKLEVVEKQFYQGYFLRLNSGSTGNFDKEFFKEIVNILTKLEGYNYQYKIYQLNKSNLDLIVYNEADIVDPSLVIADMKKAKLYTKVGIDYAKELLSNHTSIMNMESEGNKLLITQKVEKYDLDKLYTIVNKMLGAKYNVILDKHDSRIIVVTRGKWV